MKSSDCERTGIRQIFRGSMTVEAVFVVPLVLFIVFLMISYGFLEYQKVWFTAAACEAALTEGGEEEKAALRVREAVSGIGLPSYQVSVNKGNVEVAYHGTALTLMGSYSLEYQASGKVSRPNPVRYIRDIRLAGTVLEDWRSG